MCNTALQLHASGSLLPRRSDLVLAEKLSVLSYNVLCFLNHQPYLVLLSDFVDNSKLDFICLQAAKGHSI